MQSGLALPALGTLVPRSKLLGAFAGGSPRAVLMEAPAGYGKTSLAFQFVDSARFRSRLWFDASGQELDYQTLLQALLFRVQGCERESLAEASTLSLERSLSSCLAENWGQPTCLVIDDVRLTESGAVSRLESLLSASVGADSCVVVTSRSSIPCDRPGRTWYLEAQDLKFCEDEAADYASRHGLPEGIGASTRGILEQSAGHAALFVVMARSLAVRGSVDPDDPGREVIQQLEHLSSLLDPSESRLLLAAALLGSGSLRDIEDVLEATNLAGCLQATAERVPVLCIGKDLEFYMHEFGRTVFGRTGSRWDACGSLSRRCLDQLAGRGDYTRLFQAMRSRADVKEIEERLTSHGSMLLECGGASLLRSLLQRVSPPEFVRQPALLLLAALLDQHSGRHKEARKKARLATELAAHDDLPGVAAEATKLLGLLQINGGQSRDAAMLLRGALRDGLASGVGARVQMLALLSAASASAGDSVESRRSLCEAKETLRSNFHSDAEILVSSASAYADCVLFGDYIGACRTYSAFREAPELPLDRRMTGVLNSLEANCLLGRLGRARGLLVEGDRLLEVSGSLERQDHRHSAACMLLAAEGKYQEASQCVQQIVDGDSSSESEKGVNICSRAAWMRAAGDLDGALADAEAARDALLTTDWTPWEWQADVEVHASLLSLGDAIAAYAGCCDVFRTAWASGARCRSATAAMISAEAARQLSNPMPDDLKLVTEYLLTGNANWYAAMYVRAFPHLLGLLVSATGATRIPSHLLQMLKIDGAAPALRAARELLPPEEYEILRRRLGEEVEETEDPVPFCRVRVFGGLEVVTSDGPVSDADWRKRKARLLFAMLVVRKGRDVPREQLLEYLWPEMDDARAKSNFYVVWNNMKRALAPNLPKGAACPYARAAGGVCRVDDILVSSDLDEFDGCLHEGRRAEAAGDKARVVAAYQRLIDVYRGDLLPGDIYDDWFAPLRERCRQEFGDCMLRAAQILEEEGEHVEALRFVRTALAFDGWREDLYQAALRCQIASGQRSAAIETYMACRHKLTEDLGIDPSAETSDLYGRVLAMESPAEEAYEA
jgi:DNA-binding SARP family transcriptional activator/ATP/maltotriose-dependent transcriptional regulator MalT